jgi:peptidoglycan hydrolase CwlO-like protein
MTGKCCIVCDRKFYINVWHSDFKVQLDAREDVVREFSRVIAQRKADVSTLEAKLLGVQTTGETEKRQMDEECVKETFKLEHISGLAEQYTGVIKDTSSRLQEKQAEFEAKDAEINQAHDEIDTVKKLIREQDHALKDKEIEIREIAV